MPQGKLLVANHVLNSENQLATVSGYGNYVFYLNASEMQAGDEINVRATMQVNTSGEMKEFFNDTIVFEDIETDVLQSIPINIELNQQASYYITQTNGVLRNFEWRVSKI